MNIDWNNIPKPLDDGATRHLIGHKISHGIELLATNGDMVDLSLLKGKTIVYAYPRTGIPDAPSLDDSWDMILGAKGCTPESCSFRDHFMELKNLNITNVFGLSTQNNEYQQEAVERLHLPFAILSDEKFLLTEVLNLPTFIVSNVKLLKRFTLLIENGVIRYVFYPIFPPHEHAKEVIAWLSKVKR